MKLTFEALRDLDTAYVIAKIYIKIRAEKCRVNEEEIEQRISGSSEDPRWSVKNIWVPVYRLSYLRLTRMSR